MLRLLTLDGISVLLAGRRREIRPQRARALLAFLAASGDHGSTRSEIAQIFWPKSGDESHGRHSLSQTLYVLRKQIGNVVSSDGGDRIFLSRQISCDLWDLEQALAASDFEAMRGLYISRFATDRTGFSGHWGDYLAELSDAIHDRIVRVAAARVEDLFSCGDFQQVCSICDWLLHINFSEYLGRKRVEAIAAGGDLVLATRESAQLISVIRHQLGSEPEVDTLELDQRLKRTAIPTASAARRLPFVGRQGELQTLETFRERALTGCLCAVSIVGPPGIGKTSLAGRFARIFALKGGRVLEGRCYKSHVHEPYATLADLLSGIGAADLSRMPARMQAAISWLIPHVCDDDLGSVIPPSIADPLQRLHLFEAVRQLLEEVSRTRPLLLVIDDSQWLDDSSATMLHFIVRRLADSPVLLLTICRATEDPQTVQKWFDCFPARNSGEILLGPLRTAEVNVLLSDAARQYGPLDTTVEAAILKSGGVPYIIDGILAAPSGGMQGKFPDCSANGDSVSSQHLTDRAREAAGLLVCWGAEPLHFEDVLKLLMAERETCEQVVRELVTANLVLLTDGWLRLRHDLTADAISSWFGVGERMRYHLRIAMYLRHAEPGRRGQIAVHFAAAGDKIAAFDAALSAAAEYEKMFCLNEAASYLRLAGSNAPSPLDSLKVQLRLGDTLLRMNRLDDADELYSIIEANSPQQLAGPSCAQTVATKRAWVSAAKRRASAEVTLKKALNLLSQTEAEDFGRERLDLLVLAARAAYTTMDNRQLERVVEAFNGQTRSNQEPVVNVLIDLTNATLTRGVRGRRHSLGLAQGAVTSSLQAGDLSATISAFQTYGVQLMYNGRLREARSSFTEAVKLAGGSVRSNNYPSLVNDFAVLKMEEGRTAEAISDFEIVAADAISGYGAEGTVALLNLATAYYESGDFDRLRLYAHHLLDLPNPSVVERLTAFSLLGLSALELRDPKSAEVFYHRARTGAPSTIPYLADPTYYLLFCAAYSARCGSPTEALELLSREIIRSARHDVLSCMRLQLEFATMLRDPGAEESRLAAIERKARAIGAILIAKRARAALERSAFVRQRPLKTLSA